MLRHAFTLASLTLFVSACGTAAAPRPASHAAPAAKARPEKTAAKAPARPAAQAAESASTEPAAPALAADQRSGKTARKLGDFHVYQYGGAFTKSKQAVTLTEQVVAQEGDVLVVDFVLEEGTAMSALRVRMRPDDSIASVSRMGADGEIPAVVGDYEDMMKKTQFTPDSNDEVLATDHTSCLVGEENVDCDVTTYSVTYGEKHAKLVITKSASVPGRDIGGDVVSDDGKVLFSARLVERGNQPPVVESLAQLERFVPTAP